MLFAKKKPEPKPVHLKCQDCKHLIEKEDAQVLKSGEVYCPEHKKNYQRVELDHQKCNRSISYFTHESVCFDEQEKCVEIFYKTIPEHEIEVDKNGKEIKK